LSRYPVSTARFEPYLLRGYPERFDHADYYAGKGFLYLRLATQRGPVALINTHLHAEYDEAMGDEYLGIRAGQAVQLAAALKHIDEPLLVPGDFNAGEGKPVYRVLSGLSGLHDSALTLDRRQNTVRRANAYRSSKSSPDQRKDYIFYRDGAAGTLRPVALRRVFDRNFTIDGETGSFSNHDGLLAEFELVETAAEYRFIPDPQALTLAVTLLQEGKYREQLRRGKERGIGSAALAAGGVLMAAGLRHRYSRRCFLQRFLLALPVAAMLSGTGFLALSDLHGPAVLQAYDELLELLDEMATAV
jgi:endonuclease/exonuclease/phosphatase family metal-dependent hydrolase